jgi:membrane-associated phospholipid phosphatase
MECAAVAAQRHSDIRHPWPLAAAAGAVLVATWVVASRRPVPRWELRLEAWFNDAPGAVASAAWPVMQFGNAVAPFVIAGIVYLLVREWVLPIATLAAGMAAWFLAKGVKPVVGRDRPSTYLPDIVVHEGDGTGLGFVSGHSAVGAALAVCVVVAVPPRWRPVPIALAALVGLARLVVGVHLPVDVVGGWALGVLVGLAAVAVAAHVGRDSA